MEKQNNFRKPPPRGYINMLAKLCDCSRQTASNAIFKGTAGVKADFVRRMYRTKYGGI